MQGLAFRDVGVDIEDLFDGDPFVIFILKLKIGGEPLNFSDEEMIVRFVVISQGVGDQRFLVDGIAYLYVKIAIAFRVLA